MKLLVNKISRRFHKSEKIKEVLSLKAFMQTEPVAIITSHSNTIDFPNSPVQQIETYPNIFQKSFFLKTYGCQMNVSDSEIIKTILESKDMIITENEDEADIVLINTCAIRENAEQKIWTYLSQLKTKQSDQFKKNGKKSHIGILGCMAERLKEKIVEEQKAVDLIVGPDAYKDLPRLLGMIFGELNNENNNYAINTQLSIDETYADIFPVRKNAICAFISIMRGCSNMCSFCIVPFTRGIERSRNVSTIIDEVKMLRDSGVKEVTLLGQNVNSYLDKSTQSFFTSHQNSEGFSENFKLRNKPGLRFSDLLEAVAVEAPEVRFRFISPHPKDFPDSVLDVIANHVNISKCIHMPVQSGSSGILQKMNRNYSREAYINLIQKVREKIPGIAITTDLIVGFCGETEQDFQDTLDLISEVEFDFVHLLGFRICLFNERKNLCPSIF